MTTRTPSRSPDGAIQHDIFDSENDAAAARFRAIGMSYREIAAQMDCSVSVAHDRVKRALAAVPVESVTELRRIELERMDSIIKTLLLILSQDHPMISHGRRIPGVYDLGPKLAAMRELRLLSESRRKLLGLDAPTKVNVEVSDKTQQEIERLLEELSAAGVEVLDPTRQAIEA